MKNLYNEKANTLNQLDTNTLIAWTVDDKNYKSSTKVRLPLTPSIMNTNLLEGKFMENLISLTLTFDENFYISIKACIYTVHTGGIKVLCPRPNISPCDPREFYEPKHIHVHNKKLILFQNLFAFSAIAKCQINIHCETNQIKAKKEALRQLKRFKISHEHKPLLIKGKLSLYNEECMLVMSIYSIQSSRINRLGRAYHTQRTVPFLREFTS
ncbi:hypothetical protein AGLY_001853 [Aphis glycines]|uniref:Uncharacterized protein n=1 Tax=Aphis glycines TaxID=307491 RepID=A0A6G0U434_APHGL|nr:hypothetical protein AGLY_001853 [Aphis glycines]